MCLSSPFLRLQGKMNSLLEEDWILFSCWFLHSSVWSSGLCKLCIGWDLCWVFVCSFVFLLMGKAEWNGNTVSWWLRLFFCFVCCLDEVSCTGCYWWLGDAGSCIQVVLFVWVLTIWYSLGLVLSYSRVWELVFPLQRLRDWSWWINPLRSSQPSCLGIQYPANAECTSFLLPHLLRCCVLPS